MERGGFAPTQEQSPKQLPPRTLWLYDPFTQGAIPTPTDELGFVDLEALIRQTKQTVDPTYNWQSELNDEHHVYWPNAWYDELPYQAVPAQVFRNLEANKIRVPRMFHNWLHVTTEPPEPPCEEHMRHHLDAHHAVRALHRSVRESRDLFNRRWQRPGLIENGERYYLQAFDEARQRLDEVPDEFRPFELPDKAPSSLEELPEIARKLKLGKHCTMATVRQAPSRHYVGSRT